MPVSCGSKLPLACPLAGLGAGGVPKAKDEWLSTFPSTGIPHIDRAEQGEGVVVTAVQSGCSRRMWGWWYHDFLLSHTPALDFLRVLKECLRTLHAVEQQGRSA